METFEWLFPLTVAFLKCVTQGVSTIINHAWPGSEDDSSWFMTNQTKKGYAKG